MEICFRNKTVLITGATRGIGKSIAEVFAEAGANLILTGTKNVEIENLNKNLKAKGIENIQYWQADFSDQDSIVKFLNRISNLEKIDVCINNAGINIVNNFVDSTYEDFLKIQEVNLNIPYRILKEVAPKMLQQNYGRIVNIASIWSVVSREGRSMYSTSKSGLIALTKTLSVEWASHNVLVNAISPGFTLTELTNKTNTKEQLETIQKLIPARRLAEPVEMARVVAFLCSDLNTYLTGQNIVIDGGFTNV
jgi:3-oxoacyl-[acyl-carrier protein] reductase